MTSILLSLALTVGCTKNDDSGDSSVEETTWSEMDATEKSAYMAGTVSPEMKALFEGHDADEFGGFGCATCHGSGAQDGTYAMPSDIAGLDPNDMPPYGQFEKADFMYDEVTPKMVELLGYEPYDAATGEGFGCFGCHPVEAAE